MTYFKVLVGVVLAIIILGTVGFGMKAAGVFGERVIYENSFQYKEGMKQRAAVLEASIAEINARLMTAPDNANELQSQKMILEAQLKATYK